MAMGERFWTSFGIEANSKIGLCVLQHVLQTAGLPDRANFSDLRCTLSRQAGGNGKTSTTFAIDSIEEQGTHTIEISIGGSPDKNISRMSFPVVSVSTTLWHNDGNGPW